MTHRLLKLTRTHGCIAVAFAVAWWVTSCAPGYVAPPVSPQLAVAAKAPQTKLERGYALHQMKCAKCHAFEDPTDHSREDWVEDIMPEMAQKAKLDSADADAVLAYVLAVREMPRQ